MKIAFVGAVEGSRVALEAICAAGHVPAVVVTLPEELAARHSDFAELAPVAEAYGAAVHRTARSDSAETIGLLREVAPDVTLVIGWSQLCGPEFRAVPRIGCIGFHPSVLPRLRGRGVVPWTILQGETESGGTLFWLSDGADTGDIAAQARFPIDPDTITVRELYDRQVAAMCEMLPGLLDRLAAGEVPRQAQDHARASVCARRRPEDGRIDWTRPAAEIERLIRAVGDPYPGALTDGPKGEAMTIRRARLHPRAGYYIGVPGQVQAVDAGGFTVFCGDGACLDVLEWTGLDGPPGIHTKLGQGAAA